MGLINSIKNAVSGGGDDEDVDEIIDEVNDEIEQEEEGDAELMDELEVEDVEEDEEEEEWETAYAFATEMLEYRGFSSGKDFASKVMFDETSKSPMYRDRIESGTRTMSQIAQAKNTLREVKGGGEGPNLGEMAEKVENANRVIKSLESLEGKEEQMYQEIIGIAQQGVSALAEKNAMQGTVQSNMEEVDEEL